MRPGVLVYISGPMAAKQGYTIEENTAAGLRVYFDLLRRGIPAFCPHLTAAFPSAFDIAFDVWIDYDFRIIEHCSHVLMMKRWTESIGAKKEFDFAVSIDKPIAYSIEELEGML